MNWIDEGFLINKNRYNENSLICEIFTKEHGKVSGIIFGGTSKKIKNSGCRCDRKMHLANKNLIASNEFDFGEI